MPVHDPPSAVESYWAVYAWHCDMYLWPFRGHREEERVVAFHRAARDRTLVSFGHVHAIAVSHDGSLRYQDRDLPMVCVTGASASYPAQKEGYKERLVAKLIADCVADGAVMASLGGEVFGVREEIGVCGGGYPDRLQFDPRQLRIPPPKREPVRLGEDDWAEIHQNRLDTVHLHGQLSLRDTGPTHADLIAYQSGFGLGFRDASGALSHHVYLTPYAEDPSHCYGYWTAYRTPEQFIELMGACRALPDVRLINIQEPCDVDIHALLPEPLDYMVVNDTPDDTPGIWPQGRWQLRICDVPACTAALSLNVIEPLRFNLTLSDPIANLLTEDDPWRGVGGEYLITLGRVSSAERGHDDSLPTLNTSVALWTSYWLGGRSLELAVHNDSADAPAELMRALADNLRLPEPRVIWCH